MTDTNYHAERIRSAANRAPKPAAPPRKRPPAQPRPTSDSDTLSTPQVAELLGIDYRRVYNTAGLVMDRHAPWTDTNIRRFQVAVALAEPIKANAPNLSAFPAIVQAVFANYQDPEPDSWAVYKQQAVSYVRYRADLAGEVGAGAVVAHIDRLWPEKEEGTQDV